MRIGIVLFDKINLSIENNANAASYSLTDGFVRLYDVHFEKHDILSPDIIEQFDFEAEKLVSVSSNGMHSFTAGGIIYSANSNALAIDSFLFTRITRIMISHHGTNFKQVALKPASVIFTFTILILQIFQIREPDKLLDRKSGNGYESFP